MEREERRWWFRDVRKEERWLRRCDRGRELRNGGLEVGRSAREGS